MQSDIKLENDILRAEGDKIELTADTIVSLIAPSMLLMGKVSVWGEVGTFSLTADKAELGKISGKNGSVKIEESVEVLGELSTKGSNSGFAFFDRAKPESRFVLYADKGEAYIYNDQNGNVFSLNDLGEITSSLVATNNEITSKGASAGLAFFDRSKPESRFVLYANDGSAHFYTDEHGDILNIDQEGNVNISKTIEVKESIGIGYTRIGKGFIDLDSKEPNGELRHIVKSALKHIPEGDILKINSESTYFGGVSIEGKVRIQELKVSDELIIGSPIDGIKITKENIKLRTQKTPPGNNETDGTRPENGKLTLKKIDLVEVKTITEELKAMEAPSAGRDLPPVYEFDLVDQIYELRKEIIALKKEINELKVKT